MVNILLACGSGIATSTAVAAKVKDLLDGNGFAGKFQITTCSIADAVGKSAGADLVIATTVKPGGIDCPFISGIPFLTGMGKANAEKQVLDFMAANA
ncbi:PTS sugar transporter subunit IIB [Olsenella intestinalis]|uniref:PTS sugar transporter subunit IIB n=1 Tax=Olsenella intestinalis TaxID=2930083 RepID=UPI00200F9E1C|nr:PTS sugar transporter subunit IIB [Olsenella intestinalis]